MKMKNKKSQSQFIAIILLILITGLLMWLFLTYNEKEKPTIKDKATAFVKNCESQQYTTCEYHNYDLRAYKNEFINEVEKQGWKLKTVAGRYADYLYFERNEK